MTNAGIDNWHVEIIRTFEGIEKIRPIWRVTQGLSPCAVANADIDRYLSVLKTAEQECRPLILILWKDEQPKAMVVGRMEKRVVPWRVGYKTIFKPHLWCMTVIYGGVLGMPDEQVSARLVRELMRLLQRRESDLIFFNHLPVDSPFYRQVRRIPNILCRNHFPVIEPHWRMIIPKSMEEFYAKRSKKHRKHLRQYQNKLHKKYSNQIRIHTFCKPEEVTQAIKNASAISKNTYQFAMGVGFADSPCRRTLLQTAAAKGWFRGHILYLNEQPVAYRFALKYGRVYYADGTGYDPRYKDLRVGTFLFIKVLEQLCQDQTVDYYDFGFGDASYKESYSNESWQEAAATYIYAPRLYPLTINLMSALNSWLTLGVTLFLRKTGVIGWIKRMWRRKLQKTSMESKQRG